nr:alpha/beta hydrolase [uncultured Cohaesibacter sp.]
MAGTPDKKLMEIDARFSFRPPADQPVSLAEARQRSHEIRLDLIGRHHDTVAVEDNPLATIYRSSQSAVRADEIILYIHGGGWCKCDLVTHGSILTDLAGLSGRAVYGLTYPLAPEAPYPQAIDKLFAQIEAIAKANSAKLVLAGDSAGANLALALALRARDEGKEWPISALLLWYGCYRYTFDTSSHLAYGDGSNGLATAGMKQMWDDYIAGQTDLRYADLSDADMAGLPPAYLCEAECDCLADDTRWLAGRLVDAGVAHHYDPVPSVIHGFIHFSAHYDASYRSLKRATDFLDVAAS